MKYGIAIFPSKQTQDEVNSYRKRYDPHYDLVTPHVTLKEPFEADNKTINEIVDELKKIAKDTKPFPLTINKISSFAPVTNTIYLKVEPIQALIDLNEKLHSGNFPKEKTYNFVPHITIAQELSDDEYSDIYGSLKMKNFYLEETIDRIQLLYQLDNGSWTVYETFPFGEG